MYPTNSEEKKTGYELSFTGRHWQENKRPKFGTLEGDLAQNSGKEPTTDSKKDDESSEEELDTTDDPFYDPLMDDKDQEYVNEKYKEHGTCVGSLYCLQCLTIISYDAKLVQNQRQEQETLLKNTSECQSHFVCKQVQNVEVDESQELSSILRSSDNPYQWCIKPSSSNNKSKNKKSNSNSDNDNGNGNDNNGTMYHIISCAECGAVLGVRQQSPSTPNSSIETPNDDSAKKHANASEPKKKETCLWKVVEAGMEHFEYRGIPGSSSTTGHKKIIPSNSQSDHEKGLFEITFHFNQAFSETLFPQTKRKKNKHNVE
ncbi:hypothetical protein RFI_09463 [Reticulomyxa filosa]|uniref:Uncharacterized protein n=1 Tax=Reticulomyxa filosa TaxID=46433 RepID=X6NP08_RETFI|nr:hypothetical protein RFI_09463 [Reticulomyxa filosa]|eukprot:ETO27668.1 hypothetical protein RFI_09463 [Reticulomyxa filosa]